MEIRDSGFPTPIPSTMSMHAEEGTDDLNALAMDQKKGKLKHIIRHIYQMRENLTDDFYPPELLLRYFKKYVETLNKLMRKDLSTGMDEKLQRSETLFRNIEGILTRWHLLIIGNITEVTHRQMELYYQQVVITAIHKAFYHRRLMQMSSAESYLKPVERLVDDLSITLNPDTLQIISEFHLTCSVLLLDKKEYEIAIEAGVKGLYAMFEQMKIRLHGVGFMSRIYSNPKHKYKIKKMLIYTIIILFSLGVGYEMIEKCMESLTCYKDAKYFADKTLGLGHELTIFVFKACDDMERKYEDLLETRKEKAKQDKLNMIEQASFEKRGNEIDKILANYQNRESLKEPLSPNAQEGEIKKNVYLALMSEEGERNKELNKIPKVARNFMELIQAMEPDKFHEFEEQNAEWMAGTMRQFREVNSKLVDQEKHRHLFRSDIDNNKMNRTQSKRAERQKAKEKERERQLNPDEYFKTLICGTLQIQEKNLNDKYFKNFFQMKKRNIRHIMEIKEKKELKFQKDILKIKRNELVFPSNLDKDYKEIEKKVKLDVNFRYNYAHKLEKFTKKERENEKLKKEGKLQTGNVGPDPRKMHLSSTMPKLKQNKTEKIVSESSERGKTTKNMIRRTTLKGVLPAFEQKGMGLPLIMESEQERPSSAAYTSSPKKVEQENKRVLASVAEDIQREIMLLEKIENKGMAKNYQDETGTVPNMEEKEKRVIDVSRFKKLATSAGTMTYRAEKEVEQRRLLENKMKKEKDMTQKEILKGVLRKSTKP